MFPGQKGGWHRDKMLMPLYSFLHGRHQPSTCRRRSKGEKLWSESADFLRFRQTLPLLLVFALWHSLSTKVSITPCKIEFTYHHINKNGSKHVMLSLSMADNAFPYRNFHNFQNFGKKFQNLEFFFQNFPKHKRAATDIKGAAASSLPNYKIFIFFKSFQSSGYIT